MNVISLNNKILNSSVLIQEVEGVFGLIMESRSGARGKPNERNTDYLLALDTILTRLSQVGVNSINIHIVSSRALQIWNMKERQIEVDGNKDIILKRANLPALRGKISRAQQEQKKNSSTKGGNPTKRILISAALDRDSWESIVLGAKKMIMPLTEEDVAEQAEEFSPKNTENAKERISRIISLRRGQLKFRKRLLRAYDNQCAVSRTNLPEILEAAHIVPYMGGKTNHITNGLLLRTDIHTLFDLGLIGIDCTYEVVIASRLVNTEYEVYDKTKIKLPVNDNEKPSLEALDSRPLPARY